MRWWIYIIIALVLAAGAFLAGYWCRGDDIKIVRKTETVTKWIKQPSTCEECQKCMNNPLELDGTTRGRVFSAVCSDGCREARRDFELEARTSRNNIIQLQYNYDFINQAHGGSALYLRRFGRVGVGGGATVSKRAAGLLGAVQVEF